VWIKQYVGRCYGTRNWCLLWHLARLFQIKLLNDDGAVVEYRLGLVPATIPTNSGNLDPVSKAVQVWQTQVALSLQIFNLGNNRGLQARSSRDVN
jgi:hypothetical protein